MKQNVVISIKQVTLVLVGCILICIQIQQLLYLCNVRLKRDLFPLELVFVLWEFLLGKTHLLVCMVQIVSRYIIII